MDNRLKDATAVWVMEEEEQSVRRYNEMIRSRNVHYLVEIINAYVA